MDAVHEGVISNVVQEELERAPAEVRKTLLTEMRETRLELVVGGLPMADKNAWESPSLEWVHRVREEHYQKTKGTPAWLKPP